MNDEKFESYMNEEKFDTMVTTRSITTMIKYINDAKEDKNHEIIKKTKDDKTNRFKENEVIENAMNNLDEQFLETTIGEIENEIGGIDPISK